MVGTAPRLWPTQRTAIRSALIQALSRWGSAEPGRSIHQRWGQLAKATLTVWLSAVFCSAAQSADPLKSRDHAAGRKIYEQKCAMCHQVTGLGVPPGFPPLAKSDWLMKQRVRTIKVLCEGLSHPITVNGRRYENIMPAQVLDDQEVADVLSYVTSSWGNKGWKPFTLQEVSQARATSSFPTYADLVEASAYRPLPNAPTGWTLKEVTPLPEFCTRMAGTADGHEVYLLAQMGNVYRLDRENGALVLMIKASEYIDAGRGAIMATGIVRDPQGRLLIVTNQRVEKAGERFIQNEVAIFRTSETVEGSPAKPKPWFTRSYPYGIGPYNHGVGHIAFGPDGLLYLNSGARTDGGETGQSAQFYKGGEVDITAGLWQLDPNAEKPEITIFARGLRNAYGFAWDAAGHLFTVSNGPDYHAPEEMDCVERGKHYGFPYQFADWRVEPGKPYAYTPAPPSGLVFTLPVSNLGPAAGGAPDKPLATFDPHSSPAGMIWCGSDFPESVRGSFLITRFGSFLRVPGGAASTGFDLLSARMEQKPDGSWQARIKTVLAPLGRPLDVQAIGQGRVLILEYSRITNNETKAGMLPGRILEFAPGK